MQKSYPFEHLIKFYGMKLQAGHINGHILKDRLVYFCNKQKFEYKSWLDFDYPTDCDECREKLMMYIRLGII